MKAAEKTLRNVVHISKFGRRGQEKLTVTKEGTEFEYGESNPELPRTISGCKTH
jgi:hypothetical protein